MVIWLNTNQYATGLALSLFGAGFSAFAGIRFVQEKIPERPSFAVPGCPTFRCWVRPCFSHHPLVYLTVVFALALVWFLYRTGGGLILRSVGESPESAHALGLPGALDSLGAVVAGGALCGLAGAYISIIYTPLWVEGMVAGKGWIALALDHLCHLAPGTGIAWGLSVRWGNHAAVPLAGHGVEVPASCS